ncbi:MAG: cupin domain-containing protein [Actinomycetota bacterium]|nr:cupin domain-containing protein [Actinomycetota bacterium]
MTDRPKNPTMKGPDAWFTGDVFIDSLAGGDEGSGVNLAAVHFAPGARTAWHSHDGGQTLYVTEGHGLVQARGEDVVELHAGDVHVTPDGEEHWHGATHDHLMTHLSMTRGGANWGDHVTDEEYPGGD